jgi:hypothetical protein
MAHPQASFSRHAILKDRNWQAFFTSSLAPRKGSPSRRLFLMLDALFVHPAPYPNPQDIENSIWV